jgi:hypothetical protein
MARAQLRSRLRRWDRLPSRSAIVGSVLVVAVVIAVRSLTSIQPTTNPGEYGGGPPAPENLVATVRQVFNEGRCTTAAQAQQELRLRLDSLGYADWSVWARSEVQPNACVTSSIDTSTRRIVLILALRPEVRDAMQKVTNDLIDRCLGKQDAIDDVTSVLSGLGETGFEVRTDGPLTAPVDRVTEVKRHIDAGCWVYSGTGWTPEGRRLYFVSGR